MNTVKRFEQLKEKLDYNKLEKVRIETKLESLEKEQAAIKAELFKVAGTEDLEEAKTKLEQLKAKINENLQQLEELFNE